MDVLADVLSRTHASGALFGHWRLSSPWGLEFDDGEQPLSLHTVLAGELTCLRDGAAVARVRQGDLLLVRGGRYCLVHEPGAPTRAVGDLIVTGPVAGTARTFAVDGGGPATEMLCGAYTFDGELSAPLLGALPDVAVIASAGDHRLATLLALLAEEVRSQEPGQQTVLDRLLDLLLVSSLRAHWTAPGSAAPAWYLALSDPVAGPALRALHAAPARPWTVAALAGQAGVSRATLARRFAACTGRPPLAYLTQWRMQLAKESLRYPGTTVAAVAHEVGYADEFAFAAAFKREVGVSPGRYRRSSPAAV